MLKFKLLLDPPTKGKKSPFYNVFICQNREEMYRLSKKIISRLSGPSKNALSKGEGDNFAARTLTWGTKDQRGPEKGAILFSLGDFDEGIVSHELNHVCFRLFKRHFSRVREENFCISQDNLTRQFWEKFKKAQNKLDNPPNLCHN